MGLFENFPYTNFHEINLDQIIKIMRQMQDEWQQVESDWDSMQDFINNYFDNLDVSEEVLQALQTMAGDGELNTIIDPVIVAETAAWLAAHITPTSPVVDNTLSIAGAAADAKATGDAVADLKEDLGIVSAGTVSAGYIVTSGQTVDINNVVTATGWTHAIADCAEGDFFIVSGVAGSSPRVWCFVDSNGNNLSVAPDGFNANNTILLAPANSRYLIVNWSYSSSEKRLDTGATLNYLINYMQTHIEELNNSLIISDKNNIFTWSQGVFNVNNGAVVASNNTIYTNEYLPKGIHSIYGGVNYNIGIAAWDVNNSWLGYWNGTAFINSLPLQNAWNISDLMNSYPNNNYKILIRKYDSSDINPTSGDEINISYNINPAYVEALISVNPINAIPAFNTTPINRAGITITATNGEIKLNGTSSGTMVVQLPIPKQWIVGKHLKLYLSKEKHSYLYIRIMDGDSLLAQTQDSTTFILQQEPTTPRIELYMRTGGSLDNVTIHPSISVTYCSEQVDGKLDSLIPTEFPAMLTIIDDDGNPKFYSDILPIIQSKHVSIASAFYNSGAGTPYCMTWDQLTECYENGAEILSHSYDHQTSYPDNESEEEIEWNYNRSKNGLISRGFYGGRYLVYSGATGDNMKARTAAERVYNLAFTSGNQTNYPKDIDLHFLKRYAVESEPWSFDENALKGLINDCLTTGGWMVWMIHTSANIWSPSTVTALSNAIDYARAQGLPIVSVDHVYNKYLKNL